MSTAKKVFEFTSQAEERADRLIASVMPEISRTQATKLIKEGFVFLGGEKMLDPSRKIKAGEKICVEIPEAKPLEIKAADIPLNIVYEDEHLLVIDKPAGLTVHPAPGHEDDTLVNALLAHCGDTLSGIGGVMRPGIVHRLDKDTSGLMLVAKNDAAHKSLAAQLADRTLSRTYIALVFGMPKVKAGRIETLIGRDPRNRKKMAVVGGRGLMAVVEKDLEARRPLERGKLKGTLGSDLENSNGKIAITNYKTLVVYGNGKFSKVECKLETGRTHQIRVHLSHIGCSIIGDPVYGRKRKPDFPRQALHAAAIEFIHPASNKLMAFESKIPTDISELESVLSNWT